MESGVRSEALGTHRWGLEIDRAFGVEDEVKQAAVGIVALELDLEGRGEVERLRGSCQARLDVVGLLGHGEGVDLLQLLQAVLILDLLLVIGDQGLFLHIAVVEGSRRSCAILIGSHRGRWIG